MTRITTTLMVFLIAMNSAVIMMAGSGLSEDLGVEIAPGVTDKAESLKSNLRSITASAGFGDTLFSVFASAFNVFELVVAGAFALPTALTSVGFPAWAVTAISFPMYALAGLELVYALSGRELI